MKYRIRARYSCSQPTEYVIEKERVDILEGCRVIIYCYRAKELLEQIKETETQ